MYIYHALINALSAHMIHINLNMIFYTHVEPIPTKTTKRDQSAVGQEGNCSLLPWAVNLRDVLLLADYLQ